MTLRVRGRPFLNMVFMINEWYYHIYSHIFLACRSPAVLRIPSGKKCFHHLISNLPLPCFSAYKKNCSGKKKIFFFSAEHFFFPCQDLLKTKIKEPTAAVNSLQWRVKFKSNTHIPSLCTAALPLPSFFLPSSHYRWQTGGRCMTITNLREE